jgi:hypothetical protein
MPIRAQLDRLLQFHDLAGLADRKRPIIDATGDLPGSSQKRRRKLSSASDASNDQSQKMVCILYNLRNVKISIFDKTSRKPNSSNSRKTARNEFSTLTGVPQHLPSLKTTAADARVPLNRASPWLATINLESYVAEDVATDLGSTCETELPDISWTTDGDRFMYSPFQSAMPCDDLMLDLDSSLPRASSSPHAVDTRDYRAVLNPGRISENILGSSFKSPCSKRISRTPLSDLMLNASLSHFCSSSPRSQASVDNFSPAMTPQLSPVHVTSWTPLKIPDKSHAVSVLGDSTRSSEDTRWLLSSGHSSSFESWHRCNRTSSAAVPAELNVLDDPDPWRTIGDLLDLKPMTDHDTVDEPVWSYDRRGVGYAGNQAKVDARTSPTLPTPDPSTADLHSPLSPPPNST